MKTLPDILTATALLVVVVGLYGALTPGFLASVNASGIPRWAPIGCAAALAVVSVVARRGPGLIFRGIAAFWAIGAAAFVRPGLRQLDLPEPPLELPLVPLAVLLAVGAFYIPTAKAVREALTGAALLPLLLTAVIVTFSAQRPGMVVPTSIFFYALVVTVAMMTTRAARETRSTR